MIKSIIVAQADNQVIGANNQLPWHMPNDLQYFLKTTLGHYVIMGRKTFESLPKSLKGRTVIIITQNLHYKVPGCLTVSNLAQALALAEQAGEQEVFIAGGAMIYQEALPLADRIYLTAIKATVRGDAFFPALAHDEWLEINRTMHQPDAQHAYAYDFVKLIRKR